MKVWSRDKYIEVVMQKMQSLPKTDVVPLRDTVGNILSFHTDHLGNPFEYVTSETEFQNALGGLFATKSVNDIDVNTSLILQDLKKTTKEKLDILAIEIAAAFLKSVSNIATYRQKKKTPPQDKMKNYNFFAKLALNSIIEHQTKLKAYHDTL